MKTRIFGNINGQEIKSYLLTDGVIEVEISTLGATILSIKVPDKFGNYVDVCLGYLSASEYLSNEGYVGATIGRVANRIGGAKFTLNGKTYEVGTNDNGNSLHGGINGFDKKIWSALIDGESLILSYNSVDKEEGFPSNVCVKIRFSVANGGLKIDYEGLSDGETPLNLTNHAYFNLGGENSGDTLDTLLTIDSDYITPVDAQLIPTGEFMEVKNTPFDFNSPKRIGQDIYADNEQLKFGDGYDINYLLNGKGFRKVATAKSPKTGIILEVFTDQIGLQFYSGNMMKGYLGKSKTKYEKWYAFCLETQGLPNAVNCPAFPDVIVKKGKKYKTSTEYKFSVK